MSESIEKISELILKLSLSGLPPSFQEFVINNIGKIGEKEIDNIIKLLDALAQQEKRYLTAADKYRDFYDKLSKDIKSKLNLEVEKMQEELLKEMLHN